VARVVSTPWGNPPADRSCNKTITKRSQMAHRVQATLHCFSTNLETDGKVYLVTGNDGVD